MINAVDLVRLFQRAIDEKWGYIWGKRGQVWTAADQATATRAMTVQYGAKWIGRRVADCSGLFYWAFRQLGGEIYHGSNTIWNRYCTKQGKLINGVRDDSFELRPGTAVFYYNKNTGTRGHIGLYIGNGKVIEAKGTKSGVIISNVERWHEWGELEGVLYEGDPIPTQEGVIKMMPTVRQGDRGAAVTKLQELLTAASYEVGAVDGIFGGKTREAVRAFQSDMGLKVDGIVGRKTWAAINNMSTDAKSTQNESSEPVKPEPIPTQIEPVIPEAPKQAETITITLKRSTAQELYEALKGVV